MHTYMHGNVARKQGDVLCCIILYCKLHNIGGGSFGYIMPISCVTLGVGRLVIFVSVSAV